MAFRIGFAAVVLATLSAVTLNAVADAGASAACSLTVDQRPGFHVLPRKDWCNDPNGPMWFNGVYHLFFQFNPEAAKWGDMHWGHAVSKDLAHWQHLPAALAPDMPYDHGGVFTGSTTIVNGAPVATYTCVGSSQLQCLAYPANVSDPFLVNWTKPAINPVVATDPPNDVGGNFRDPTTAWETTIDGTKQWAMVVGASLDVDGVTNGSATLYTSPDFKTWSYHGVLYSTHDHGGMWECPDFYPLGSSGQYILKRSAAGQDWYTIGTYDQTSQRFSPTSGTYLYDYGQWYASKSFHDPVKNRQILWGWVAEEDGCGMARGWASTQSLPRTLTIDPTLNILLANPIQELQLLRASTLLTRTNVRVSSGAMMQLVSAGQQFEVGATFARPDCGAGDCSFGLFIRATADLSVRTEITFTSHAATGPFNNTDMPGGDYRDFSLPEHVPESQNVDLCRSTCEKELECLAWTYVRAGDPVVPRCSLKASTPATNPSKFCVSGTVARASVATNRTLSGGDGPTTPQGGAVPMVASDDTITLHVFGDHSIVETFAQGGRARVTSRMYPATTSAVEMGVFARGVDVTLNTVSVWSMGPAFAGDV